MTKTEAKPQTSVKPEDQTQNKKRTNLLNKFGWMCFGILVFLGLIYYFAIHCVGLKSDEIGTLTNFFVATATFIAACTAVLVYTGWKDQHNKQILAKEAKEVFHLIHEERNYIHELKFLCKKIINNEDIPKQSWYRVSIEYEKNFLVIFNCNKDEISTFCFLSSGQFIYDIMTNYLNEVSYFTEYIVKKRDLPASETTFLNSTSAKELLDLIEKLESKNSDVLNELKSYIFIER